MIRKTAGARTSLQVPSSTATSNKPSVTGIVYPTAPSASAYTAAFNSSTVTGAPIRADANESVITTNRAPRSPLTLLSTRADSPSFRMTAAPRSTAEAGRASGRGGSGGTARTPEASSQPARPSIASLRTAIQSGVSQRSMPGVSRIPQLGLPSRHPVNINLDRERHTAPHPSTSIRGAAIPDAHPISLARSDSHSDSPSPVLSPDAAAAKHFIPVPSASHTATPHVATECTTKAAGAMTATTSLPSPATSASSGSSAPNMTNQLLSQLAAARGDAAVERNQSLPRPSNPPAKHSFSQPTVSSRGQPTPTQPTASAMQQLQPAESVSSQLGNLRVSSVATNQPPAGMDTAPPQTASNIQPQPQPPHTPVASSATQSAAHPSIAAMKPAAVETSNSGSTGIHAAHCSLHSEELSEDEKAAAELEEQERMEQRQAETAAEDAAWDESVNEQIRESMERWDKMQAEHKAEMDSILAGLRTPVVHI